MKRKLISSTVTYSFLTFLQPAISFFLLPVFLTYFSVEEYGIYSLINTFSYFLGVVAAFRIYTAIHSYYFDYRNHPQRLNEFMGTIISFSLFSGILLLVILYFVGDALFDLIFKNEISFFPYGLLGSINGIFLSLIQPFLTFLRNEQRVKHFTFLTVLLVALTVILQLGFIIIAGLGISGALLGRAIALIVVALTCIWAARHVLTFRLNKKYLREALYFSLPLIPFSIVAWISRYMDRYVIENMTSLEVLGIYTLLITICLLIIMANDGLINGVQPFLFDILSRKNPDDYPRIQRLMRGFLYVLLLISSLLVLIFGTMEWWLPGSEFIQILPYLGAGVAIYSLYAYYSLFKMELLYNKKTAALSAGSTFYAIIFVLLLIILVPEYGIWGALISNLTGLVTLISVTRLTVSRTRSSLKTTADMYIFPLLLILLIGSSSLIPLISNLSYLMVAVVQFPIVSIIIISTNYREIRELKSLYLNR